MFKRFFQYFGFFKEKKVEEPITAHYTINPREYNRCQRLSTCGTGPRHYMKEEPERVHDDSIVEDIVTVAVVASLFDSDSSSSSDFSSSSDSSSDWSGNGGGFSGGGASGDW